MSNDNCNAIFVVPRKCWTCRFAEYDVWTLWCNCPESGLYGLCVGDDEYCERFGQKERL